MHYVTVLREVRDVLENERHFLQSDLGPQQIVMVILEFGIREVVPPIRKVGSA